MAWRFPTSLLNKVDFPTLGLPTIATMLIFVSFQEGSFFVVGTHYSPFFHFYISAD
jgi:hypothetical protein